MIDRSSCLVNGRCRSGRVLAALALLLAVAVPQQQARAQPSYDYDEPFLATSQLGFRPESPKTLTLLPGDRAADLPDEIPFYVQTVGSRLEREIGVPAAWGDAGFRWPFDIIDGPYADERPAEARPENAFGSLVYEGALEKKDTRWGPVWQADFSGFDRKGFYQIETERAFTAPFAVEDFPYDRFERSYLDYLYAQRSGREIPGVRPAENTDDALLSSDTTTALPVAGGWNNAGDHRKWLFLTLGNLSALAQIANNAHPAFAERAREEIAWGNRFYHNMITDEGRVYEDVGGGYNSAATGEGNGYDDYDPAQWWNEGHSGVTGSPRRTTDEKPLSGDERFVRDAYNPLVQFLFVRHQAVAATALEGARRNNALVLANKAWQYGHDRDHDERTLFLAEELRAAVELYAATDGRAAVTTEQIAELADRLLERQETNAGYRLSGYFMEEHETEAFRSIAFPALPAMALLRLSQLEAAGGGLGDVQQRARRAVERYAENYLLADAETNPFGYLPYGIYVDPPRPEDQRYRDAGGGRVVRSFIHVFDEDPIPHGNGGGLMHNAYFLARAGDALGRTDWQHHAERVLQWRTGHNPAGLSLYLGIGFKHPVPANFVNYKVPESPIVGFLGRPDDTPYQETSHAIEWSTQEVWDVPFYYTIGAITYLRDRPVRGDALSQR